MTPTRLLHRSRHRRHEPADEPAHEGAPGVLALCSRLARWASSISTEKFPHPLVKGEDL